MFPDLIPKIGYNGRVSSALERSDRHQLASTIRTTSVTDRRYIYFRRHNAEHDIYLRANQRHPWIFFLRLARSSIRLSIRSSDIDNCVRRYRRVALIEIQINIQFEYINVCAVILNTIGRRYPLDRGEPIWSSYSLIVSVSHREQSLYWNELPHLFLTDSSIYYNGKFIEYIIIILHILHSRILKLFKIDKNIIKVEYTLR